MNETKINQILEEIYQIDPELKKEEGLLKKILIDMAYVRPDIVADRNFVLALRRTLLERADELSGVPARNRLMMPSFFSRFALAGAGLALLIILPAVYIAGKKGFNVASGPVATVSDLSENAFGRLSFNPAPGGRGGGGGGGGVAMMDGSSKEMSSLIYPGPDFTQQIIYKYSGDEFELPAEGFVYRKKISPTSARQILGNFRNLPLSKLSNPLITDMSFSEDRDYGYNISVSLREGTISFYQNWERWPVQDTGCATEECYRRDFIPKAQFPVDEGVIGIAERFLADYGISLAGYGKAEVIEPWRYSAMPDDLYPPDINIIYPHLIEGIKVYDEWGSIVGINVNVNLKTNRVTGASNIFLHGYDKSKYSLTSDKNKVMELAAGGGTSGDVMIMNREGSRIEPPMLTPELVYMQYYMYDSGKNEVMYVPALRFPVDVSGMPYFFKQNVIVPLVPDIMDSILSRRAVPPAEPRPMPVEPMPLDAPASAPVIQTETASPEL